MDQVASALAGRGLTITAAAKEIGVGSQTLQKHLSGEHVRSDSARKYENWMAGRVTKRNVFALPVRYLADDVEDEELLPAAPKTPRLVVDIFSGCGGLSLGFDLLGGGHHFRTILAVDNQDAPIAVLNRNAALIGHGKKPVGRRVDLTEFMNEAEFLTYYLQHVANVLDDKGLYSSLYSLDTEAFPGFLAAVSAADHAFIQKLNQIRLSASWRNACEGLDRQALNQTSVVGFHDKLRLPRPSFKPAELPPVLWCSEDKPVPSPWIIEPSAELIEQANWEWDREVEGLSDKRHASGRGQLTASARRVAAFVAFLESNGMSEVRKAWITWRARRLTLRSDLFGNGRFYVSLRRLY
ncbi:MAG: DNA cytosine methyltransferase, partial [Dechloromonas sp.]